MQRAKLADYNDAGVPSNPNHHARSTEMSETKDPAKSPVFDPTKLEQLNVATDYPMEKDDFEKLFKYNCYCEMAHVNKKGFPIVTPMFYVIVDNFLYMSSIKKYRHKVMD